MEIYATICITTGKRWSSAILACKLTENKEGEEDRNAGKSKRMYCLSVPIFILKLRKKTTQTLAIFAHDVYTNYELPCNVEQSENWVESRG